MDELVRAAGSRWLPKGGLKVEAYAAVDDLRLTMMMDTIKTYAQFYMPIQFKTNQKPRNSTCQMSAELNFLFIQ